MNPVKIGIVGCGAVVERFHLPASIFIPEMSVEALVDRDETRAKRLADVYGVPRVYADYKDIIGRVDAAIIALPHNMNAFVSKEFLTKDVPVLVEKPLAVTAEQAQGLLLLRSEEHTSELQSRRYLVCRLLLEKKKYT